MSNLKFKVLWYFVVVVVLFRDNILCEINFFDMNEALSVQHALQANLEPISWGNSPRSYVLRKELEKNRPPLKIWEKDDGGREDCTQDQKIYTEGCGVAPVEIEVWGTVRGDRIIARIYWLLSRPVVEWWTQQRRWGWGNTAIMAIMRQDEENTCILHPKYPRTIPNPFRYQSLRIVRKLSPFRATYNIWREGNLKRNIHLLCHRTFCTGNPGETG